MQAIAYDKVIRNKTDVRSEVAKELMDFLEDQAELFSQPSFQAEQGVQAKDKISQALDYLRAGEKNGNKREPSNTLISRELRESRAQLKDTDDTVTLKPISRTSKKENLINYLQETSIYLHQFIEDNNSVEKNDRKSISEKRAKALSIIERTLALLDEYSNLKSVRSLIEDAYMILGGTRRLEEKLLAEPHSPVTFLGNLIALKVWHELSNNKSDSWKAIMETWQIDERSLLLPRYHHDWSHEVAYRFVSAIEGNAKLAGYLSAFHQNEVSERLWLAQLQTQRQTTAATQMAQSIRLLARSAFIAVLVAVSLTTLDAMELVDTSAWWDNVIEADDECFLELIRQSCTGEFRLRGFHTSE